jgi:hypothetical protein
MPVRRAAGVSGRERLGAAPDRRSRFIQFVVSSSTAKVYRRSMDIPQPSTGLMIPGERERNTLTYRQLGSMGGPASGSAVEGASSVLMDATTIAEHQREGGGAASTRKVR